MFHILSWRVILPLYCIVEFYDIPGKYVEKAQSGHSKQLRPLFVLPDKTCITAFGGAVDCKLSYK